MNMSVNHKIKEQLYLEAKAFAKGHPELKTLVGKCMTVSNAFLPIARDWFGGEVRLVVGSIEINSVPYFNFTENDLKQVRIGNKSHLSKLHCWLAVGVDVLDLTLSATAYHESLKNFPRGLTYIDMKRAKRLQLKYIERLSGDSVLLDIAERKFY